MWRDFIARSRRSGGLVHRPGTREQVQEATEAFLTHYNDERPNQARSCGNQPPRVACSQFPTLPAVPEKVHPDRWLRRGDQQNLFPPVGGAGGGGVVPRGVMIMRVRADAACGGGGERRPPAIFCAVVGAPPP